MTLHLLIEKLELKYLKYLKMEFSFLLPWNFIHFRKILQSWTLILDEVRSFSIFLLEFVKSFLVYWQLFLWLYLVQFLKISWNRWNSFLEYFTRVSFSWLITNWYLFFSFQRVHLEGWKENLEESLLWFSASYMLWRRSSKSIFSILKAFQPKALHTMDP